MSVKSKQFFSINSTDASNYTDANDSFNINQMNFNFNNTNLTNIQTSHGQKCVFNPVNVSIDWDYINISEALKNNKFQVLKGNPVANTYTYTIPDDSYNALNLCSTIQDLLNDVTTGVPGSNDTAGSMVFIAQYDAISNRIAIMYTAQFVPITFETYPLVNNVRYNMTRILGTTKSNSKSKSQTSNAQHANGVLTKPVYFPFGVDFKVADVIRIHSNCAKRFFELKSGRLSQNSVLFELVVPNISNGSTLIWENYNSDIYSQEIFSNFDNLNIEIRSKDGSLVPFKANCQFNMTFTIERELEQPDPKERLKNLQNFNQLSSV
jgi:hypothetical protein